MNIQFLNGGLANQIFQYIFTEYARLSSPINEEWYLDDSFFFVNNVHNGYELEKVFNLKPKLLSQSFDADIWNYLLANKKNGISVPQSMKNLGFKVTMLAEYDNYRQFNPFDGDISKIPPNQYIPELAGITSKTQDFDSDEIFYMHGYFLNPGYFNAYKEHFLKQLAFQELSGDDTSNLRIKDKILNSRSTAVHIRRGDYVTLGFDTPTEFYLKSIKTVLDKYSDTSFFVFSDDIPWCRQNASSLGLDIPGDRVFYIDWNVSGRSYIDLMLMSLCNIIICGKSSFSQLAIMLDSRLEYFISEIVK